MSEQIDSIPLFFFPLMKAFVILVASTMVSSPAMVALASSSAVFDENSSIGKY